MKKITIIIPLLVTLSAGCAKPAAQSSTTVNVKQNMSSQYNRSLMVGDKKINAQVVTTAADMEQGLSDRPSMTDDEGMLFVFGTTARPAFWMKGMNFDLDLVWIRDGKIIGITPNVRAPVGNSKLETGNLPLYSPPSAIDQVLEVNAGWTEKNKIKIGDEVRF